MKTTKFNVVIKSIFILLLLSGIAIAQEDSLVVDESGNVGIGTSTPSTKLEVNGDLQVNGIIKKGGTYSDWYVGSYYSIPADQRTGEDWGTSNLTTNWNTVDFSSKLPQGVKRIRIYLDFTGAPNKAGRIFIRARPFGAPAVDTFNVAKTLLQTGMAGTPRLCGEIEVDVVDGKFEIAEVSNTWEVTSLYINLRGFYM